MKTRYQFFFPLVNGNNGPRRCSIFHGGVIRIKAASSWLGTCVPFFFFYFFFFLPRAHRIYVYITNNVSLVPQKMRGRNGAITREQDEPFIRIKFLA